MATTTRVPQKSTKIKDPLIRCIHRVLRSALCQRKDSSGVVNLRELTCFYCTMTHQPIDVAYMLLINMATNATADTRTPIFYGG
ncbi:hypothetical protein Hanom_Chr08g00738231 [Helianthus anomalus]